MLLLACSLIQRGSTIWASHQHHNTIKIKGSSQTLFKWQQRWHTKATQRVRQKQHKGERVGSKTLWTPVCYDSKQSIAWRSLKGELGTLPVTYFSVGGSARYHWIRSFAPRQQWTFAHTTAQGKSMSSFSQKVRWHINSRWTWEEMVMVLVTKEQRIFTYTLTSTRAHQSTT